MSRAYLLNPHNVVLCEATRRQKYSNDHEGAMPLCKNPSMWKIDGKNFCKVHAGQAALSILMEDTKNV